MVFTICQFALAYDIQVTSEKTNGGITETLLGFIPGIDGTRRLSEVIGKGRAEGQIFTVRRMILEKQEGLG